MYKSQRIDLRLSPREIEILDEKRGSTTRSAFIRNLIALHDGHPHPDPHPEPLTPEPAPVPSPITPPVPPPNPVETFTPPIPIAQGIVSVGQAHKWVTKNGSTKCTRCGWKSGRLAPQFCE